jgi:hypothetical protein
MQIPEVQQWCMRRCEIRNHTPTIQNRHTDRRSTTPTACCTLFHDANMLGSGRTTVHRQRRLSHWPASRNPHHRGREPMSSAVSVLVPFRYPLFSLSPEILRETLALLTGSEDPAPHRLILRYKMQHEFRRSYNTHLPLFSNTCLTLVQFLSITIVLRSTILVAFAWLASSTAFPEPHPSSDLAEKQASEHVDAQPLVDLGYEVYRGVANASTGLNTFLG